MSKAKDLMELLERSFNYIPDRELQPATNNNPVMLQVVRDTLEFVEIDDMEPDTAFLRALQNNKVDSTNSANAQFLQQAAKLLMDKYKLDVNQVNH